MGRGISRTRSSSRQGRKQKRQRSLSVDKLKATIERIHGSSGLPELDSDNDLSLSPGAKGRRGKRESAEAPPADALAMVEDEELEASEDEEETINRPDVMAKYKFASKFCEKAMNACVAMCVPGTSIMEICQAGDAMVLESCGKVFNKGKGKDKTPKGIAYPTNVSVNNYLANVSPMNPNEDYKLQVDDVVKVNLGVHIDGYPVISARTIVIHSPDGSALATRSAQCVLAAQMAMNGMIRMMRPGTANTAISDYIARVGKFFNVNVCGGVLSHRMKRWVPDGAKCIIARRVIHELPQQDVEECRVGLNEIWNLDVAFTDSSAYKTDPVDVATTIYKRNEIFIPPRLTAAEFALKEIDNNFLYFPFHCRNSSEPKRCALGVANLLRSDMVDAYGPVRCKQTKVTRTDPAPVTARFSCTVAVSKQRIHILGGDITNVDDRLVEAVGGVTLPEDIRDVVERPLELSENASTKRKKLRKEAVAEED